MTRQGGPDFSEWLDTKLLGPWPTAPARPCRGVHWGEVAEFLGVEMVPDMDPALLAVTRFRLQALHATYLLPAAPEELENAHRCVDSLRAFLSAHAREGRTHSSPVWRALATVEDDATFLELFIPLIEFMRA